MRMAGYDEVLQRVRISALIHANSVNWYANKRAPEQRALLDSAILKQPHCSYRLIIELHTTSLQSKHTPTVQYLIALCCSGSRPIHSVQKVWPHDSSRG